MNYKEKEIANGVSLVCVNACHFKTNEIAISLAVPLKKETAAANALMISLLSRRSAKYPDLLALNKKLASLYGAELQAGVSKVGECQVLKLGLTCLDDRFSLDGESISLEGVRLLLSLVFEPMLTQDGLFRDSDVESEKRILIQKLESEENDKRAYALRQAEKIMFENEPYGINRFGTATAIRALTSADVKAAWDSVLSSAKVMVTVVGDADEAAAAKLVESAFADIERSYLPLPESEFVAEAQSVKEHMERINVKQGKLVLGFRVNLKPDDALTPAMRSFCDIFGGGPYSKLFANVREKLSLCYYCSARYIRAKSVILIQCGCNEENMDKAVNEILNQLEIIKNGSFEEEFASSKISLSDTIMSVNDAPEAIESWYASQINESSLKSPECSAQENNSVTMQQVQACASLLTLDTVYKLSSPKEAQ